MKLPKIGSTQSLHGRREVLKKIGGLGVASVGGVLLNACGGSSNGVSNPTPQVSAADQAAAQGYRMISVNAASSLGTIRSLQGVNGPPVPLYPNVANIPPGTSSASFSPTNPVFNPSGLDLTKAYKQLGIDFVRTHDLDADGTGDLDGLGINRIFPDWNADPLNPASYNFAPADAVIAGIVRSNSTVFFSLGRSDLSMVGVSNDATPPADFAKYAQVAAQVVAHYNKGWANGFNYGIKYWEIWNEPCLTLFWTGTPQQYYDLYKQVATAIKAVDPTVKIGGPTIATNNDQTGLMGSFLQFVQTNNLPLDFYSFHWYAFYYDPLDFSRAAASYRNLLNQYGFDLTELHLNEWGGDLLAPLPSPEQLAAFVASSLSYMQDAPIDRACDYQRDYPLLQSDGSLTKAGSAFAAVGGLSAMSRLSTTGQDDDGLTVLAGSSADKSEVQVLISNYQIPAEDMGPIPGGDTLTIPNVGTLTMLDRRTIDYSGNAGYYVAIDGLPWGTTPYTVSRYRIDSSNQMTLIDTRQTSGAQCTVSAALPPPSVELIVLKSA